MFRNILTYGVIAGLIVGVLQCGLVLATKGRHQPSDWAMVIGYTIMLIALAWVFLGVKRYRDVERGGVIGFWPALGMGLAISFVAGILYALSWELTLALAHWDFGSEYADYMIAQAKAHETGAALQRAVAEANEFRVNYQNPLYRLPMTFTEIAPVGVLVSLVTAGLLRNSRFLPVKRA
ncbi:MAG TPA: DUF4199 domain-containing protein [Rhizomicrobium sp.]|nr:DUF4199 domain-containing protein [Rhizomicrobium sp.]